MGDSKTSPDQCVKIHELKPVESIKLTDVDQPFDLLE